MLKNKALTSAIIDGDILAFTMCASVQREVNLTAHDASVPDQYIWYSDPQEAFDRCMNHLWKWDSHFESTELAFSVGKCFRYGVFPEYKANRAGKKKPLAYSRVVEMLYEQELYKIHDMPHLEADDVMGLLRDTHVILTADKDLLTVPGWHGDMWSYDGKPFYQSESEANLCWMEQTLTGDTSDGYPGCPGVGPKGAVKIVQNGVDLGTPWANTQQLLREIWIQVTKAYAKKDLPESRAVQMARLARILRPGDLHDSGAPKLWSPEAAWGDQWQHEEAA